jgi:hypothetical protein
MTKKRQNSHAKRAELEHRLKQIRSQETTIRERIYKLEASIAAAPGLASERRLRLWNTIPAEESPAPRRAQKPTRWQRQLKNSGRSRQAVGALFMVSVALLLTLWLSWQLKTSGLL